MGNQEALLIEVIRDESHGFLRCMGCGAIVRPLRPDEGEGSCACADRSRGAPSPPLLATQDPTLAKRAIEG